MTYTAQTWKFLIGFSSGNKYKQRLLCKEEWNFRNLRHGTKYFGWSFQLKEALGFI